ncbi:MAG TPA: hypothetical protein VK694_03245 [Verrucomicrobiae bacterium]|nr:hypothetical protein [Verrucomicrobiae bacterium]
MVLAHKLKRPKALAAAALLILASAVPIFTQDAHAYGLIGLRKITMSSSANGTLTAGQDVTYEVDFDVATTSTLNGLVVDFCANSPIVGEACTPPTGFDIDAANLAVTINAGLTSFAKDTGESDANTLVLNASSPWSATANDSATFTLGTAAVNDGIDNPENANTTFYARILTFTTTAGADNYDSATAGPGNVNNPGAEPPVVDAGGIAMSTAAQITVTSKVQEKLTFCVYTSAVNYANCTVSGTAVILGDTNGVLDTAGPYVDKTTKYNVATNASQGAAIRIKGDTLKTGSFDIAPFGAAAASSAANTEQFGFCTYRDAGGGAAGLTATTPYDSAPCSSTTQTAGTASTGGVGTAQFAFDTNGTDGTMSTYGDPFASKPAGDFSTGVIVLAANIANTTEAGIYTTVLTFIATGTY